MIVYNPRHAEDGSQPRRPEEARKVSSLGASEGPWPRRVFDFGSIGSRSTREYSSLFPSPLVCGVWLGSRRRPLRSLSHDPASSIPPTSPVSPSRIQPRRDHHSSPAPSGLHCGHLTGVLEWPLWLSASAPASPPPCVYTPSSAAACVSFCKCTFQLHCTCRRVKS